MNNIIHLFMIGIIYKFTIINGSVKKTINAFPFYIGQHWENNSVEFFLSKKDSLNYCGSGKMWNRILLGLKKKYPNNWRNFIHREVLYAKEGISQKALDVLEEHFIKKYKSHYSFGLGGCNILWGTANKFGSGSPMKDPNIAKKVTEKIKGKKGAKRSELGKRNMKIAAQKSWLGENRESRRKKVSEGVKKYRSREDVKEFYSKLLKGRIFTEEHRRKISENHADFSGVKHPRYGVKYRWITNGEKCRCLSLGEEMPNGWYYGKIQKGKIYVGKN